MIELKALFLCDSANVRENLLGALGGGLTRVGDTSFPIPLLADLALIFEIFDDELAEHQVMVECSHIDSPDDIIFRTGGPISAAPGQELKHVDVQTFPLVLPLNVVGIPNPGLYEIRVELDGHRVGNTHFVAELIGDE
jgi:hypothetical protein